MQTEQEKILELFPKFGILVEKLLDKGRQKGLRLLLVYGLRTFKEQEELYAKGRTAPGAIITKAPPGKSWHNYGLAVDIAVIENNRWISNTDERWDILREIADGLGFDPVISWDKAHFQKSYGLKINDLYNFYQNLKSQNKDDREIIQSIWKSFLWEV